MSGQICTDLQIGCVKSPRIQSDFFCGSGDKVSQVREVSWKVVRFWRMEGSAEVMQEKDTITSATRYGRKKWRWQRAFGEKCLGKVA